MQSSLFDFIDAISDKNKKQISFSSSERVQTVIYGQSKSRFLIGCFWIIAVTLGILGLLGVSAECFLSATTDKEHEWLYILIGSIILIFLVPFLLMLNCYLPHFFISAIIVNEDGILLPLPFLLVRKFVLFSDLRKMYVETNGLACVETKEHKKFLIPHKIDGLSQLLWYISEKSNKLQTDEFIECRIKQWIERKEDSETTSLI